MEKTMSSFNFQNETNATMKTKLKYCSKRDTSLYDTCVLKSIYAGKGGGILTDSKASSCIVPNMTVGPVLENESFQLMNWSGATIVNVTLETNANELIGWAKHVPD